MHVDASSFCNPTSYMGERQEYLENLVKDVNTNEKITVTGAMIPVTMMTMNRTSCKPVLQNKNL